MKISAKKIITCVLLVICLFLCAFIGFYLYERQQELNAQREEQERIMAVPVENPDMPEEYRKLKADNPDVYGWIMVEGTDISYPILQSQEDNAFYLAHNPEKEESEAGSIFSENYNSPDFTDFLTVLYGNCMEDGSMFGELLNYEDPVFFEENREIKVLLPDKTLRYYIFATYTGDNSHLLLTRDLSKEENRNRYISDIFRQRGLKNNLDKSVGVGADDKILALSTGHPTDPDSRFIVQSILRKSG